jgi:hypothetical protein
MSTSTSKSDYLLLFRGHDWDKDLSPEELQQFMSQVTAWFEELHRQGRMKAGKPLGEEGKVVSGKNGRTVADGPFAESKEAIGGYLLVEADDFDHAVTFAKACPMLAYGSTVEVRPVLEECSTLQRVKERLVHATA